MIYHAKMDISERRQAYASWKNGDVPVLIGTSALGAGIDHSGVRLVIHHGYASSMINFCQETGRAGRDGNPAEAVTLFWPDITQFTGWINHKDREPVLEWIRGTGCKRAKIGKYLNGVEQNCLSMAKGESCCHCEKVIESTEVRPMNIRKRNIKRGMDLAEKEIRMGTDLKEMIGELRSQCTLC